MAETTWDKKEKPLINPNTGLPQIGGLICPLNTDDTGPAKKKVHCLVYKNYEDWDNEGRDYHGPGTRFCAKSCHYGRMPMEQQARARREREAFWVRKWQRNRFAQKVMEDHKIRIPMIQPRKIARWPRNS